MTKQTAETNLVFVLRSGGTSQWIERRTLRTAGEPITVVESFLMPAGEKFPSKDVFADWNEAVAEYWRREAQRLAKLKREVKNLEKRLRGRKEPRFLKRER